jgi:hypothetical protein
MSDQDAKPTPGPDDAKTPEKKPEVKEGKEGKEGKETIKIEKLEYKDFKDNKDHKVEVKEHKPETKEHKDHKDHKDHKIEVKEHKPETKERKDHKDQKVEVKEHKPESKEIKDQQKPEIKEKETIKVEGKEVQLEGPVPPVEPPDVSPRAATVGKFGEAVSKPLTDVTKKPEIIEKNWNKDIKDIKDSREYVIDFPGLPIPDPLEQRLAALEQAVVEMSHFIQPAQRPDLSEGALRSEPDAGEAPRATEGEE